jgi:hypothetical protein
MVTLPGSLNELVALTPLRQTLGVFVRSREEIPRARDRLFISGIAPGSEFLGDLVQGP